MSLQEKLLEDMKAAMRARDETRLSTLRMLRSAINYAEIDKRGPLDDAGVLSVIEKDAKRHRESIEAFQKGNRPELAAKEEAELKILLSYLPQQLTDEEIAAAAAEVIAQVGATGPGDIGKVMAVLAPRLKGKADGRLISQTVQGLLK
jgi:uncharacterized protein YqeY